MPGPARMSAHDRQEQLVRAAVGAFARGGYTGTTTDQVARRAGVSQPYVLRVFGSKQDLFLAVARHATEQVRETFRDAASRVSSDADVATRLRALGEAYLSLSRDDELLLVMQHGFMAAGDPALGPTMRRCFTDVHDLVVELTGADPDQARDFVAHGMLINTMVALRMPDHVEDDPEVARLVASVMPDPGRG